MNREQKELLVSVLKEDFKGCNASFLVTLKGIPVSKIQELRKGLKSNGGTLKVAKTRLMKIAVQGVPCAEGLTPFLKDQLGVVFSNSDSASIAKVIYDFAKVNEKLGVIAGCFESKVINKEYFELIATLPSRDVLLSQLCGVLMASVGNLARALSLVADQKNENKQ